jgi:hypothetical protein
MKYFKQFVHWFLEHKAFMEFVPRTQIGVAYFGFSTLAVAVQVTRCPD